MSRGATSLQYLHLGEGEDPVGGVLREYQCIPDRPSIVADGVELETVWFPHRDARSLLQEGHDERTDYSRECQLAGIDSRTYAWR